MPVEVPVERHVEVPCYVQEPWHERERFERERYHERPRPFLHEYHEHAYHRERVARERMAREHYMRRYHDRYPGGRPRVRSARWDSPNEECVVQ